MKTRNGIYYDLTKSTYKFKVPDTGVVFIFSSDLHLCKFEEKYKQNRVEINLKLRARFGVKIETKTLPDVLLYKKIETRGFLMVNEGGQKLWLENLELNGEKVTLKS